MWGYPGHIEVLLVLWWWWTCCRPSNTTDDKHEGKLNLILLCVHVFTLLSQIHGMVAPCGRMRPGNKIIGNFFFIL